MLLPVSFATNNTILLLAFQLIDFVHYKTVQCTLYNVNFLKFVMTCDLYNSLYIIIAWYELEILEFCLIKCASSLTGKACLPAFLAAVISLVMSVTATQ